MENMGEIWGGGKEPAPKKTKREDLTLRVMQQAAWSWLIDTVENEYTRLVTGTYTQQGASRRLREYLSIKILVWDKVMSKQQPIPDEFRDEVFEAKSKMEGWTQ